MTLQLPVPYARKLLVLALLLIPAISAATRNAASNGQWISLGVPSSMSVGTNGVFYLRGSDMGACASVTPTYFRVDTSAPKWKEFYVFVLYSAAKEKALTCAVDSGCGTTEVWVSYCGTD